MPTLRNALFYSFAGKYSTMVLEFVLVMVLSRILAPSDLGVYSLAAGSIVIGQMLRDFGLSLYLIQEKDLTTEKIQTCFSISLTLCWAIALAYFLSAQYIAAYFEQQQMVLLVKILALNFVFIPFGTFSLSLLKRDMLFNKIMLIDITSTVLRASVLLVLLFYGFGLTAMAIAAVAGTITTVVMAASYAKKEHYQFRLKKALDIIKFTSFVSMSNVLTQMQDIVPEMIIGKKLAVDDVAFFGKATATLKLFSTLLTSFITPVIQPYMSKMNNEEGQTDQLYYKITNYMLAFQWPFCVAIFVFSEEIVSVLYGDQWGESVPLTRVLALVLFVEGFLVLSDQLLNAVGQVKYIFKLASVVTLLRVVAVFICVDFGLIAVAYAFLAISLGKIACLYFKVRKVFAIKLSRLGAIYLSNIVILLCVLLASYGLKMMTPDINFLLKMAIYVPVFAFSWVGGLMLTKHDLIQEFGTIPLLRNIFKTR